MAKFKWFDGNMGFYGYDQFDHYLESSRTPTGLVLTYDPSGGVLDPTLFAARIELTYAGYASYMIEDGPNAGQQQVTGGTLTAIRYYSATDSLLLEVTRTNAPLAIFMMTLARGDASAAWHLITRNSNNLVGSFDASGPAHPGNGDVIDTGIRADTVNAGAGDDFIQDRGGADVYNGGGGFDTVAYDGWFYTPEAVQTGISADLVLGKITGPDGSIDSVSRINAVNGTFLVDVLKGDAGANSFMGYAGSDQIDGRGGFDMASYAREGLQGGTDGIRVNLAAGTVRDGFGYTDHLISIEGVEGTATRDTFFDNGFDNFFSGGAGDDTLHFSAGYDIGRGGLGADTFIFRGATFGDDTIEDFAASQGDVIDIELVTSMSQLTISTVTVNGQFAAFVETVYGSVTLLGLTAVSLTQVDFGL